jgi:hypothetical protein
MRGSDGGTKGLLLHGHRSGQSARQVQIMSLYGKRFLVLDCLQSCRVAPVHSPVERPQFAPRAGAVSLGIARHETASFARIILPNKRGITWHTGENHIHPRPNSIPSRVGQSARRCWPGRSCLSRGTCTCRERPSRGVTARDKMRLRQRTATIRREQTGKNATNVFQKTKLSQCIRFQARR